MSKFYVTLTLAEGQSTQLQVRIVPLRGHMQNILSCVEQRHGYLRKSEITVLLNPREVIRA